MTTRVLHMPFFRWLERLLKIRRQIKRVEARVHTEKRRSDLVCAELKRLSDAMTRTDNTERRGGER